MSPIVTGGCLVVSSGLIARPFCYGSRFLGAALLTVCMFGLAEPAFADQTLMVADNSRVDCVASSKDLTRISLVGDEIASVSKVQTDNPTEDFSVVNEPIRGDIYISVPEGFTPKTLSFFATSKKGYVYKFACRLQPGDAQQVFVANPAIAKEGEGAQRTAAVETANPQEAAVRLVQAMYSSEILDGYQMRQPVKSPAFVGALKVQLIAEYAGATLTGKVLRIENRGHDPITLTEAQVGPPSAVAVTIAEPKLDPGRSTTAYLVLPAKGN